MSNTDGTEPSSITPEAQVVINGLRADLADARQKAALGRNAQEMLENLRTDKHFKVAEFAFQRGVDPDLLLDAATKIASGEAAAAAAAEPGAAGAPVAASDPEARRIAEEARRISAENQQGLRAIRLTQDAARFCRDYGIDPRGPEAQRVRVAAERRVARTREDADYGVLDEIAETMGMTKVNATASPNPAVPMAERGRGAGGPITEPVPAAVDLQPGTPGYMKRLNAAAFERWEREHASKGR